MRPGAPSEPKTRVVDGIGTPAAVVVRCEWGLIEEERRGEGPSGFRTQFMRDGSGATDSGRIDADEMVEARASRPSCEPQQERNTR
jgi:hypothetical protein